MNVETRIVYSGPSLNIGEFRCHSSSPLWRTENYTGNMPAIVFPRVAVGIRQANQPTIVATPNHVMLYNAWHPYQRQLIDARGDECEFYRLPSETLIEIARHTGTPVNESHESPFRQSFALCSSRVFLAQRAIYRAIIANESVDDLQIEELFFDLLNELFSGSRNLLPTKSQLGTNRDSRQTEMVEEAKALIGRNYRQPLKLDDIASYVDSSPFHLCRVFRNRTGLSIHNFLMQCRLRRSLEFVLESNRSLIDVALDLGFSSHSHFTNSFHKNFGTAPDALRKTEAGDALRRLTGK